MTDMNLTLSLDPAYPPPPLPAPDDVGWKKRLVQAVGITDIYLREKPTIGTQSFLVKIPEGATIQAYEGRDYAGFFPVQYEGKIGWLPRALVNLQRPSHEELTIQITVTLPRVVVDFLRGIKVNLHII